MCAGHWGTLASLYTAHHYLTQKTSSITVSGRLLSSSKMRHRYSPMMPNIIMTKPNQKIHLNIQLTAVEDPYYPKTEESKTDKNTKISINLLKIQDSEQNSTYLRNKGNQDSLEHSKIFSLIIRDPTEKNEDISKNQTIKESIIRRKRLDQRPKDSERNYMY